jgi:hypothetical protein
VISELVRTFNTTHSKNEDLQMSLSTKKFWHQKARGQVRAKAKNSTLFTETTGECQNKEEEHFESMPKQSRGTFGINAKTSFRK